MSYTQVRDDLITLLRGVTNFDANNVAAGDFSLVNRGFDRAMVVSYMGVDIERETSGRNLRRWRFGVVLFEKLSPDEASVETRAAADREAILNRVMNYPQLNSSHVRDAVVVSGEDLGDETKIGGVRYFRESFEVQAIEDVAADYQE